MKKIREWLFKGLFYTGAFAQKLAFVTMIPGMLLSILSIELMTYAEEKLGYTHYNPYS